MGRACLGVVAIRVLWGLGLADKDRLRGAAQAVRVHFSGGNSGGCWRGRGRGVRAGHFQFPISKIFPYSLPPSTSPNNQPPVTGHPPLTGHATSNRLPRPSLGNCLFGCSIGALSAESVEARLDNRWENRWEARWEVVRWRMDGVEMLAGVLLVVLTFGVAGWMFIALVLSRALCRALCRVLYRVLCDLEGRTLLHAAAAAIAIGLLAVVSADHRRQKSQCYKDK